MNILLTEHLTVVKSIERFLCHFCGKGYMVWTNPRQAAGTLTGALPPDRRKEECGGSVVWSRLEQGLSREQSWRFGTGTALSQNTSNSSPGETLVVTRCPAVKLTLLKSPFLQARELERWVKASSPVIEFLFCIELWTFLVNEHNYIEETHGSIIH